MKYALMVYPSFNNYFNIGDYIQSLAAEQYLPRVDIYLNREKLNSYLGESVKLIMNGWFLHESENWPPNNKIVPLIISFHLNSDAYDILENPQAIEYFRTHEPIGCRDIQTAEQLLKKGVKAYFTGCLTLTLGRKYKSCIKNNLIYFVDPYFESPKNLISIIHYINSILFNYKRITKICSKLYDKVNLKNLIKTSSFYIQYRKIFETDVLENSEYLTHQMNENDFVSESMKFDYARVLIEKYASAKLVVTSKIHCALPCLGLETPVIYIDDANKVENSSCRLDGLIQLFNSITYNRGDFNIKSLKIDSKKIGQKTLINNKELYIQYKLGLIAKCEEFVK